MGNALTIDEPCGCHVVNAEQCNPTRQFVSFCPLHESAKKMHEALLEITEGAGPYSRDRLEHAANCIEYMKSIALKALPAEEPKR
jgi:hypothetical protein